MILSAINWGPAPEIFKIDAFELFGLTIGPLEVRWYGLLFATGFLVGQAIFVKIFRAEGKPEKDIEALTLYMVLSTIIGARLGHCLFYDPDYYLSNPLEILQIWKGGLASHGAAFGIILSLWYYCRSRPDQPFLWLADRMVIVACLGGAFIRLGNLMNSEIVGVYTDVPWGFVFERLGEDQARHPAQLYESISCLILFFILYGLYNKWKEKTPRGRLFGIFLVGLWGLRFLYEFIKKEQVTAETDMSLFIGQYLSIPLVLLGFYILYRSYTHPNVPDTETVKPRSKGKK
ncbi:MAG: prolipoprotein diacylglyceryl transferase [Flammeovirgaceae bacterium]